jgi:hypothetical protein
LAFDGQSGAYGTGAPADDAQAVVAWLNGGGLETKTIVAHG